MNSIVTQEFEILHETQAIRNALMEILDDADLAYTLPGANPPLGKLCAEIGQVEMSYTNSFKTFTQDWTYASPPPGVANSVEGLKNWYAQLDAELDATLTSLAEHDIENRMIERGFQIPVRVQVHIYREALLIFYAKAMVYLNAIGKTAPDQMRGWIG